MRTITRTVWILSLVSLFTDMASEMLYPVMPVYLQSIGFSVLIIGILEGVAEATAGLSKGYFGKWSDTSQRRVPFVQIGYAFSAVSKPMMALFIAPLWVFAARTLDRLGKGIRTGARDAILSGEATKATKAKVFGFHRSMDTLGAVMGPLFALLWLYYHPEDYRTLFLLAFAPGLLAVVASFLLKEKGTPPSSKGKVSFFSFVHYWHESPRTYRQLVLGLLGFALFNSSDVFLLLKAKSSGMNDSMVIGIYIFYNLVYALFAFPLGMLADKIGLKKIFITGLVLFAIVYFGMSMAGQNLYLVASLFLLYGLYAAATEGVSKAWITNITEAKDAATAVGSFSAWQSICSLIASSLTGFMWFHFGAAAALAITAIAALAVAGYLLRIPPPERHK
ncbi:MAG TPA: MFS transporter [Phnomibacter sp.]|nr:MFS transporter [Phnomibacter sp.]